MHLDGFNIVLQRVRILMVKIVIFPRNVKVYLCKRLFIKKTNKADSF